MTLFNELPGQLLNASSTAYKASRAAADDAMETGDIAMFEKTLEQLHLTTFAHREHGRLNHAMLKSTFDSFQ